MSYFQQEPIGGIGENRVFSILTVENVAGAAVGGGALYGVAKVFQLGGSGFGPGFWIQLALILAGAALGAGITVRVHGLSLVDRIGFWAAFQMRKASGQTRIDPPIATSIWAFDEDADDILTLLDDDFGALAPAEARHGA